MKPAASLKSWMASRNIMQTNSNVYKPRIPLGPRLDGFFFFFLNEKSQALFRLELCTLHKPCNLTLTHRPGDKINSTYRAQRPWASKSVSQRKTSAALLWFLACPCWIILGTLCLTCQSLQNFHLSQCLCIFPEDEWGACNFFNILSKRVSLPLVIVIKLK